MNKDITRKKDDTPDTPTPTEFQLTMNDYKNQQKTDLTASELQVKYGDLNSSDVDNVVENKIMAKVNERTKQFIDLTNKAEDKT